MNAYSSEGRSWDMNRITNVIYYRRKAYGMAMANGLTSHSALLLRARRAEHPICQLSSLIARGQPL